jgi:hypothetical protein
LYVDALSRPEGAADGPAADDEERVDIMQLRDDILELRRRIAQPGYYRQMLERFKAEQPSEVVRAREAARRRALAEHLASIANLH